MEPSAREVEGQQFFWALALIRVWLGPKNKYLFNRQLYKLQAKISGHAVGKPPKNYILGKWNLGKAYLT